jgi:hypothetical protein
MRAIKISKPTYTFEKGVHRISTYLQGQPLWFETSDYSLQPSLEAFLSAILIPAFESNYDIEVDAPLSPVWMSNVVEMSKILTKWWGYRGIEFDDRCSEAGTDTGRRKTALCFSGGVDSFHNLLRGSHDIDYLICAYGLDIPLGNADRIDCMQRSLQDISEQTNARPIAVRTNLREHPFSANASWTNSHGGALAALGHMLNQHFDRLVISASYPLACDTPWGSHWETDPLWSSESLQVIHEGAELWRTEKLRILVDEPLVRKHLRVCIRSEGRGLNCGRCEKCIRTMLILAQCGELDGFVCFDNRESLLENVDRLRHIGSTEYAGLICRTLLNEGLEKKLSKSVEALLRRTRRRQMDPRKVIKKRLAEIRKETKRLFRRKLKIAFREGIPDGGMLE